MNLNDITAKAWILALFVRDDGERFLLGDGYYDFKESLQHFQPNTIASDIVELQGTDGQLLAGQVRRSSAQSFDGYVGDNTVTKTEIEKRRRAFLQFFRVRRFYNVIYIFADGSAITRKRGYLTDAPSVPEMWQIFPEYHVALNFENVNYYEYAENAAGDEIFANVYSVKLSNVLSGGLVWDEDGAYSEGIQWSGSTTLATTSGFAQIDNELDGAPMLLSQLTGNATQQTYSGKNLFGGLTYLMQNNIASWSLTNNILTFTPANTTGNPNITFSLGTPIASGTTVHLSSANAISTATQLRDDDMNIVANFGSSYNLTRTLSGTATRITFNWASDGTTNTKTINLQTLQIEAGSTATSYEPYVGGTASPNPDYPQAIETVTGEQTITISDGTNTQSYTINLGSIELAKIGTYQDRIYKDEGKWYIEKQVGKVVYDGTEVGWFEYTANVYAGGARLTNIRESLCDYAVFMPNVSTAGALEDKKYCWASEGNDYRPLFKRSDIADLATWKTWLGTHNMTVYYALATPTTTEITDETLLSQLNFIASLYGGVNNISIVGTGAQGEMEVVYYTSIEPGAGYVWDSGEAGGPTNVEVAGIANAQPKWTVIGPAVNPTLTNVTTGQSITWTGTVPSGQSLVVDMGEQTAELSGANVYAGISGDWIELQPGMNRLTYDAQGGATEPSKLEWNGVVG